MNKSIKLTLLFILPALLLAMISSPRSVAAQENEQIVGLSISPAIYDTGIVPGTSQDIQVTIQNTTDVPLPIRAEANSLIPNDPEIEQDAKNKFDASKWIHINNSSFILEPGEITQVRATIIVPPDVNPGGHYAQITFRVVTDILSSEQTAAQIVPEVSAALFLTAPGEVEEEMTLDTSNLSPGYVQKGSKTILHFKLLNSGNIHQLPQPKITVLKDGEVIEQFVLQPQIVLPNTIKEFETEWIANVDWGEYDVQAELVYGSQGTPLSSTPESFRVGPTWWQALLIAPLLLLLIYIIAIKLAPKTIRFLRAFKLRRKKRLKNTNAPEPTTPIGDYQAISEFLGSEEKPKYLTPMPPVNKEEISSAEPIVEASNEEVIKVAVKKEPDEPAKTIPVNSESTVTELDDSSNDSKTVIVQTSSTTIIRQESKDNTTPKTPEKSPKPKKKQIKINVAKDTDSNKPKETKAKSKTKAKPKKPGTRSEKSAKSAPKKKKKNQKTASRQKNKK